MAAGTAPEAATAGSLLERDEECARLRRLLDTARGGQGGAAVLHGPAGIGKTALLGAMTTGAGLAVLRAEGRQLERRFAWGGVRQLFETAVAAGVRPSGATALAGPTLIAVDDLHWLDEPSLRYLAYLIARVGELPVAVVMATRPSDDPLLRAALAQSPVAEVSLGPLSPAATAGLLQQHLGTAPVAAVRDAAHAATGGNPLLLTELARALRARGVAPGDELVEAVQAFASGRLSTVVRDRMVRLSPSAQACAEAVAVLGEASPSTAAAVADLDETTATAAADALVRAGVLRAALPLAFDSPLLRAAVVEQLPPARRAHLHLRAARVLRAAGAPPERCAAHWAEVPDVVDAEAVTVLREAAARAAADGAPDVAVAHLSAALAATGGGAGAPQVLAELGVLEARLGRAEGVERLRAAIVASDDVVVRTRLARELAARLILDTRWDDAAAALEQARDDLGDEHRDARLLVEADLLGVRAYGQLRPPRAPRVSGLAGTTPGQRAALRAAAFAHVAGDGTAAAAIAAALRAAPPEADADDPVGQWQQLYALVVAEAFADAERLVARCERDARERGLRPALALHLYAKASVALRTGRLHDALAWADEGRGLAAEVGVGGAEALCRAVAVEALVELGRHEEAATLLGPPVLVASDYARSFLLMASVAVSAAQGDHEAVIAATGDHLERERDGRARNPAVFPARSLRARALAALGSVAEARALVDEELDLARRFGAVGPVAVAEREAGLLAGPSAGLPLLQASVERLRSSERHLEHARSLLALGAALRRGNRREDARGPLRTALELATRAGAAPLAGQAREELAATGVRAVERPLGGVAALTPSERRVALLAAEGRGNREIAQTLFVTLRTVETHLTHAYRKLGITSRTELASALER